jgi:hypothetical protein
MLSCLTFCKCYHFCVIIFPCTAWVLSFMLSFNVIIFCYHFPPFYFFLKTWHTRLTFAQVGGISFVMFYIFTDIHNSNTSNLAYFLCNLEVHFLEERAYHTISSVVLYFIFRNVFILICVHSCTFSVQKKLIYDILQQYTVRVKNVHFCTVHMYISIFHIFIKSKHCSTWCIKFSSYSANTLSKFELMFREHNHKLYIFFLLVLWNHLCKGLEM